MTKTSLEASCEKDLVYARVGDRELTLDLYWHPEAAEPEPLVIYVHGGAFREGSKDNPSRALTLLDRGTAVASISYRFSQEALFPAQIQDCRGAVRFLRAHSGNYRIDPDQIGIWGGSAGGHLAAMVGVTGARHPEFDVGEHLDVSGAVQAVCDFYGPTDFLIMNAVPGAMDHDAADSPESELVGGPIQDNHEAVRRADPAQYAGPEAPPTLIVHGMKDELVPLNQGEHLHARLHQVGAASTLLVYPDLGHGLESENDEDVVTPVHEFFSEHLGGLRPAERGFSYRHLAPGSCGLRYVMMPSRLTGERALYAVYLPPSYQEASDRRYPVVYWLPGRGGNPGALAKLVGRFDRGMRLRECPEFLFVAPASPEGSMYCNAPSGNAPVESLIVRELVPHVDETYRTVVDPDARMIDGFSMGGFGACRLGLLYPDVFGVVSIVGAALHSPEFIRDQRTEIFAEAFGGDMEYCRACNPWTLARQRADAVQGRSVVRLIVGAEDERLRKKNQEFHALMDELGIDHEYHMIPDAGHDSVQCFDGYPGDPLEFYRHVFAE